MEGSAAVSLHLTLPEVCLRLLCALVVGIVIGTEREYTHRPAGMRTHMLVSLGACVVAIISQMLFAQYSAFGATPDPARLSAQVVTGVGFLGAGTILREGATVKGLTTAASLWAVACLGIGAGYGYYGLALAGMVFIFVTLTIFELLQRRIVHGSPQPARYTLITSDAAAGLEALHSAATAAGARLDSLQTDRQDGTFRITCLVQFDHLREEKRRRQFLAELCEAACFRSVTAEGMPVQ